MNNEIQPELVSLRTKLAASIEQAEKKRDLLSKQIEKDRALLHAINSSLSVKVSEATGPGGLAGAVRAVVKSIDSRQFSPVDIEHEVLRQFPAVPINKQGIRTALWNMLGRGELRPVRKGNNQQPALYERIEENRTERTKLHVRVRKHRSGAELLPTNGDQPK